MLMLPVAVHPKHLGQEIDSDLVFDDLRQCEKLRKRVVFTYPVRSLSVVPKFLAEDITPQLPSEFPVSIHILSQKLR